MKNDTRMLPCPFCPADPRIAAAEKLAEALREALEEKCEYMLRNHLGDPSQETVNKHAYTALAAWEQAVQQ